MTQPSGSHALKITFGKYCWQLALFFWQSSIHWFQIWYKHSDKSFSSNVSFMKTPNAVSWSCNLVCYIMICLFRYIVSWTTKYFIMICFLRIKSNVLPNISYKWERSYASNFLLITEWQKWEGKNFICAVQQLTWAFLLHFHRATIHNSSQGQIAKNYFNWVLYTT